MAQPRTLARRDFLSLLGLGASLPLLTHPLTAALAQPARRRARRIIDVHCHVFNAKDLPVEEFSCRVFAREKKFERACPGFMRFTNRMNFSGTPTARQELDCLSGPRDCLKSRRLLVSDALHRPRALAQMSWSLLLQWPNILRQGRATIVRDFLNVYQQHGRSRLSLIAPALVDFNCWLGSNCRTKGQSASLEEQMEDLHDQVRVMDLVNQEVQTQADGAYEVNLRARVHGYAPYDPLRQILAEKTGLEKTPLWVVREAIGKHGFLGVKLYPPMGFRPDGNRESGQSYPDRVHATLRGFGLTLELGEELDRVLWDLYVWCAREGVPIMAHAYNSQAAGDGYGCRASPAYWRQVLKRIRENQDIPPERRFLRLNLAHFGVFDQALECSGSGRNPAGLDDTWEWELGRAIAESKLQDGSPGPLFADLGDFHPLFDSWSRRSDPKLYINVIAKKMKSWIAQFDPQCEHLLFGTDWSMIVLNTASDGYIDRMEEFFRVKLGLGDQQIANFLFNNAVRFFGLGQGQPARQRLEKYYADRKGTEARKGLDRRHLDEFDRRET